MENFGVQLHPSRTCDSQISNIQLSYISIEGVLNIQKSFPRTGTCSFILLVTLFVVFTAGESSATSCDFFITGLFFSYSFFILLICLFYYCSCIFNGIALRFSQPWIPFLDASVLFRSFYYCNSSFSSRTAFLSLKISLLYPYVAASLLLQLLSWYPYTATNAIQKHIITVLERVKNRRYTRTFGRDRKTQFQDNYAVINESPSPCVPKLAQIASFNPRNACTLALDLFYNV